MKINDGSELPIEEWRPGVQTRMLVSAQNGATQLCLFEQWVAPGNGAPTHSHPVEEVLTVHAGEAEMWLDQEKIIVKAGQSLIVPAGRRHGFCNSGAVARCTFTLCWHRRFSKRCRKGRPRWYGGGF